MIHVANSVAGCSVMIDIMCIMTGDACMLGYVVGFVTGDACMLGYVVGFVTGRPGVSAWAVITRRPTVFCHATMITAVIMSGGRGTSRASVAAMIIIAGGATTVAAVGTMIAAGVASRGPGTATAITVSAAARAIRTVATAATTVATTAATTTVATTTTTTTTTATVATATATATVVRHGTLDMPCMRRAIEPPGSRSHRQSTRAYRQSKQQRASTSVRD